MMLSKLTDQQLQDRLSLFEIEFERLMKARNSSQLMIERIVNPNQYPQFHSHLEVIHELWIRSAHKTSHQTGEPQAS